MTDFFNLTRKQQLDIVIGLHTRREQLEAEVERYAKQVAQLDALRHEAEQQRDKYRKQVQLGFKHLMETPVLTDEVIQEGYTLVEHLRMALAKALGERDDLLAALERLVDKHRSNTLFDNGGHWPQAREAIAKVKP